MSSKSTILFLLFSYCFNIHTFHVEMFFTNTPCILFCRNKDKPGATADDDSDEKLILFDTSAAEDKAQPEEQADQMREDHLENNSPSNEEDLLGLLSGPNSRAPTNASELYGEFESSESAKKSTGMTNLLSSL